MHMSTFTVTLEVASIDRSRWETVEALADSGSSYSCIPREVLERVGVEPHRSIGAELADGRIVESQLGRAFIRLEGGEEPDVVMFGEPGEPALLGAHTLEGHSLAVDPVNERLIPVRALRMRRRIT